MFSRILCSCWLAGGWAGADQIQTRVDFPNPAYDIFLGQEFRAPVRISPLPASGLFSYGLIITVEGNNGLIGITTMIPAPALDFDGVLGAGSRGVAAQGGRFSSKGTVNLLVPGKPNFRESALGNLAIANLPEGTYTVRLATHNTLGPSETIFVDGDCRPLDTQLVFGTTKLTVIARPEGTITAPGLMTPDRQTGLLLQQYEVKNTGRIAAVFRILIRNMPAGATVWNAHGTFEGIPYVDLPALLAPGATQKITLEYRSQDRTTVPRPTFELVSATAPAAVTGGLSTALQPRATMANGNVMLEFNSAANKSYYIQYTADLAGAWNTALPKITGTGNRIQWFDNGPPKTERHPSVTPTRFYRIVVSE